MAFGLGSISVFDSLSETATELLNSSTSLVEDSLYEVVDSGLDAAQFDAFLGADALNLTAGLVDISQFTDIPSTLTSVVDVAREVADLNLVAASATSLRDVGINNISSTITNFASTAISSFNTGNLLSAATPILASFVPAATSRSSVFNGGITAVARAVLPSALNNNVLSTISASVSRGIDAISRPVSGLDEIWGVNPRQIINTPISNLEPITPVIVTGAPYDDITETLNPGWSIDENNNPVFLGDNFNETNGEFATAPPVRDAIFAAENSADDEAAAFRESLDQSDPNTAAAGTEAKRLLAQNQETISNQRNNKANGNDWRVRLRLAPNAQYLYNAEDPGILRPLKITDGIIFPYTPNIETSYKAEYDPYSLTHSNFKGYFYKSSSVEPVNIRATFTAQDTAEANYLLAVIHFFRSATKMFYGQDTNRGAPPPLVFLSGLGEFQFNNHPCVISTFSYNLPADVDYIRAGVSPVNGTNMQLNRDRVYVPSNPIAYALERLKNSSLFKGAETPRPSSPQVSNSSSPTYVPTKMEISITLFPIQTRQQVSDQFSVEKFAKGNLLRGGFW